MNAIYDSMPLAEQAFTAGRYEQTLTHCGRVLAADPHNGRAHVLCGQANLLLDRPAAAQAAFEQAIACGADSGGVWFGLAGSQMRQQRFAQALDSYAKALQKGCKSELEQQIYYQMGMLSLAQNDPDAALLHFEKADRIPVQNPYQSNILTKRAEIYIRRQDWENAALCARQLTLLHPDAWLYQHMLLQIYLQQRRLPQAEALLEAFCQRGSLQPAERRELAFDQAVLLCLRAEEDPAHSGELCQAAAAQLEALCQDPAVTPQEKAETAIMIAEIQLNCGNTDLAIQYAAPVAALEDAACTAFAERARFLLAECHAACGDYAAARRYALLLKNSQTPAYRYHGIYVDAFAAARLAGGDAQKQQEADRLYRWALAYYRNCMAADPTDQTVTCYRIKCYADIGQFDSARALCRVLPAEQEQELCAYIRQCEQPQKGE